jgi:hypothetical protein
MRSIKDKNEQTDESSSDDNITIVIPVKNPFPRGEAESLFLKDVPNYSSTSNYDEATVSRSRMSLHSTSDSAQKTIDALVEQTGTEPDDDMARVAECAAFWRAAGADTLIYCCSIGGTIVANGLIIRFLGFNPLYSTLIFGGAGAIAYSNAQILFTSLLHPPKESIPENRQTQYTILNRYALLPLGFIVKSAIGGTILSALGDTSLGTQQVISASTGPVVGPVMAGIRTGVRKCIQGTLIVQEGNETLGEAFDKAYSTDPNTTDSNRPYRFGTVNGLIAKVTGITASTLGLWYSGGFKVESYCIPTGNHSNYPNINMTGLDNSAFPQDCYGGNVTFMFRELGISFGYAVGFMVIEPLMVAATNKVYDYFYPAPEDSGDDVNLEEIGNHEDEDQ